MKTYWVDDERGMLCADIPDDVSPDGVGLGAPCPHVASNGHACTAIIAALDYESWESTCNRYSVPHQKVMGHRMPLPAAFIQAGSDGFVTLYRRGSLTAPTFRGEPVQPPSPDHPFAPAGSRDDEKYEAVDTDVQPPDPS